MPKIPLDKGVRSVIVLITDLDYVVTTSSCQGHGRGTKKCSIGIAIPDDNKTKLKLFDLLVSLLRDRRLNIQMSPGGNLFLYFEYSRDNVFRKTIHQMEETILMFIKENE